MVVAAPFCPRIDAKFKPNNELNKFDIGAGTTPDEIWADVEDDPGVPCVPKKLKNALNIEFGFGVVVVVTDCAEKKNYNVRFSYDRDLGLLVVAVAVGLKKLQKVEKKVPSTASRCRDAIARNVIKYPNFRTAIVCHVENHLFD